MTTTLDAVSGQTPWTSGEFVAALRAQGERYHNLHPFHVRMNAGELTREELQLWVANRYMYQIIIPRKDAAILRTAPTATCVAHGSRASTTTTATTRTAAGSSRGSCSVRRSASTARR